MFSNNINNQLYYINPLQDRSFPYGVNDFARDQYNEYLREYELNMAINNK